jgi:RND superfamily putative drug exporter
MFTSIARFDIRLRWLIVALWIVGAVATIRLLPSLSSITQSNNAQFLSATSPSVEAANLAAPFQGKNPSGSAVLVAYRASGPLTPADLTAFSSVQAATRRVPGVALVRYEGVSPDGKAAEALVTVTASALQGNASDNVVYDIRATFSQLNAPPGLTFHLTGQLAASVDASSTSTGSITRFTLIFVIVLLFVVYRALLAPLITLIPAALSVAISGPLIGELAKNGMQVPPVAEQLLIVLLIGAGSDYGLFLVFRMREEIRRGATGREALVTAMSRVGPAITYSGLTVAAALVTLLLAPFGIYRGIGPALAIGIGVMLLAGLTLTPALLAIFGAAAFWPTRPKPGAQRPVLWGQVAERVVRHPLVTLAAAVVLFGALSAGLIGYRTSGLTSTAPSGSDSAAGQTVLDAHFPKASVGADQVLLRFTTPIWNHPATLTDAQRDLASDPVFRSVTGPLGTGAGSISASELAQLNTTLGPATSLQGRPAPASVPKQLYDAYLATGQFISPDGRTVQYYVVLNAGPVGSPIAAGAIPRARTAVSAIAHSVGAQAEGIAGQDASAYDIQSSSNKSLEVVVPVVLVLILILLGGLLFSLVAPWYLAATVGLSYLASLGFAMIVFVHLGGNDGLLFVLPLLMFVFSMALGEDYNILVMSRIREEARRWPTLSEAVTHAIGITGMTVTSAGLILAGTFAVLGLAGGNIQAQELGFSIAFGVVLDTFFVRTLLVPSIAMLLGRWNWWPSRLEQTASATGQSLERQRR